MVEIRLYSELDHKGKECLEQFFASCHEQIHSYQTIAYMNVVDEVFGYNNLSLVAFGDDKVVGFLPQWVVDDVIESVPWRDKGGPACINEESRQAFIDFTRRLVDKRRLKGFLWRDTVCEHLDRRAYFQNVEVNLQELDENKLWRNISDAAKRKVKQGRNNNLSFCVKADPSAEEVLAFYRLFVDNRRRLGVPVYPLRMFTALFQHFGQQSIKLCMVTDSGGELLSSLVLIHDKFRAIYAYPASNMRGRELSANDFLVYQTIFYCLESGMHSFDFGADSPLQESLIAYKLKWGGVCRPVTSSSYGQISERDHNQKKYDLLRNIFRKMPLPVYELVSRLVVR